MIALRQMLETPAPCASWMAQPIADASNSGSDDDSDLDVPLRRVSPKSRCVADGSEPDSDPTPSEDLDADSDTNSDRTLRYEVETQIDSDLDSPPDPDGVPRAQAPSLLRRSVTAPF